MTRSPNYGRTLYALPPRKRSSKLKRKTLHQRQRKPCCRISKTPLAREDTINPLDSRYFHFFLSTMAYILPYTTIFPSIVVDVFARSVPHITLRHSVLSISSMIADYRLQRPMDRFHIQYITSLRKIQHAIQQLSLDEGTTIAVFLILWIDVVRAELRSSRKHLRGLYLLLQELQKTYRRPESGAGLLVDENGGVGVSPLIMQIWRISIRLDFTTSLYLVQPPVFPPMPPEHKSLHRQWILLSTPSMDAAEWALAGFAQDDLIHRACHVAFEARKLRKSQNYTPAVEAEIQSATAELERQYREWHQRRIVQIAESVEQEFQLTSPYSSETSPSDSPSATGEEQLWTFINYPPCRVANTFYANIVLQVLATSIYISLIAHPVVGPGPNPQRFQDAVEICRIIAGLGEDRTNTASSKIWVMFLAGVVFGGLRRSTMEAQWLLGKMDEIVKMFPLMKNAVRAYQNLWDVEGDFWDEMDKLQAVLY